MIHYSCDLCGQPIPREACRYEVKIEIRLAMDAPDPFLDPADLGEEDAPAFLDFLEQDDVDFSDENVFKVLRFDLCPHCHAAYLNDPLPPARRMSLGHLEN